LVLENDYVNISDSIGFYLDEIGKYPILSKEEEQNLFYRLNSGDNSVREIIINSNLRLVASIAKMYINRGLSFLDLIQEGNIGLIIAIDKYDVNTPNRFSTCAYYWIMLYIQRAIANKGRNIRIPVYKNDAINKYKMVVLKLETMLGRTPTVSEIANDMGITIKEVEKLCLLQKDTANLNEVVSNDSNTDLEEFVIGYDDSLDDIVIAKILREDIVKMLKDLNLTDLEYSVLINRFGLKNNETATLLEISSKYNVSVEWVRKLERKALNKIRLSKYITSLMEYYDIEDAKFGNLMYKVIDSDKDLDKVNSIYEYFDNYTKDEIDYAISNLSSRGRNVLAIVYGDNYMSLQEDIDIKYYKSFYYTIVPQMKKILKDLRGKSKVKKIS
jgi:RNA polymerase primary sigma factor